MEEDELINCEGMKHKSTELVCRIARKMQKDDNLVSFSEIEDAVVNINTLGPQIKDIQDLKDIIRPALAKSEKAVRVFNKSFPLAMEETFHKEIKVKKKEDLEKELN